ncbi:MAG: MBL fold metallo-hydrolase [Bacteroidales bacterium]|nr:MBL fold metallo-hydrolase [Bacteroidaceae bacterium]MDO4187244.1 MBL fold metallo-hydrolase [Bacteroidales bacterium]
MRTNRRNALKIMGLGAAGIAFAPYVKAADVLDEATLQSLPRANQGMPQPKYNEPVVYEGPDVIIRRIDEHTWEGNGHLMANETIYLIEGNERTILLDAGTKIDGLRKIVEGITSKPITLIATHVHPDHTGSAINDFEEIWINAGDEVNVPQFMADYKGKVNFLEDGQVFDLGGRRIEVIFTPGHTPGSATFFEMEGRKWGYSGDAFGSGNLLLTTNFSTLLATTTRIESYMKRHGIEKMYPGHYMGSNPETLQRISDLKKMSEEMIAGTRKGETSGQAMMGLNGRIRDFGVNISYRDPAGLK